MIVPEDRSAVVEAVKQAIASADAKPFHNEYRVLWPDGTVRWVASHGRLCFVEKGDQQTATRLIGVNMDITERKQAEEHLLQAQKMEAVGRLAGGVAHDFNTLLSLILGYSELALAELPKNDPSRARFEQIEKSAQTGATLTRQLLAFSRKRPIAPQVVDLRDVVSGLEPMLRRLLPEDIEIVAHCAREACPVNADPSQLQQVLLNLGVNAGQAMPKGGKLTIEVKPVQFDGPVQMNASMAPGPYEMLAVSDTGGGMDNETIAHIFEPFFTTKSEGEGTGLGLATVYGIVKQSGGEVLVSSKPGSGSIFSVYLPRSQGGLTIATAKRNLPRVTGSETILLVDDSRPLRELTSEVLSRQGYLVLEAADGVSALEISRTYTGVIHLLITDIVMPRMRGTELAEHILKERPETALVFLSGYAEAEDKDALSRRLQGSIITLEKPCSSDTLLQNIRRVLDQHQSHFLGSAS